MKKMNWKLFLLLQVLVFMLALTSVCSKKAGQYPFFSLMWCVYYAAEIGILVLYALGWQQVIKRLPLTVAYASREVGTMWGLILSALVFSEAITLGKLLGAMIGVCGVMLFMKAGEAHEC